MKKFDTLIESINIDQLNKKLINSAKKGNLKEIIKYISRGADIHAQNDSALILSSIYGHLDILKYLIENGANFHVDGDDALIVSAEHGHLDIVKYLVSLGLTSINDAFRFSAEHGHLDIVKYLVSKGANIHTNDDYALKWSKLKKYKKIIKYLESL